MPDRSGSDEFEAVFIVFNCEESNRGRRLELQVNGV